MSQELKAPEIHIIITDAKGKIFRLRRGIHFTVEGPHDWKTIFTREVAHMLKGLFLDIEHEGTIE